MSAGKGAATEGPKGAPVRAGYIAVAAEEAAEAGEPYISEQKWQGGLLQCCGSCNFTGIGSCLLSYYLPCVAFGQNARRAFNHSAWLHGLTYLLLFFVAAWASSSLLMVANHNVLAKCNGDLPGPQGSLLPHHPRGLWGKSEAFKKPSDWDLGFELPDEFDKADNDDDDDGHHDHHGKHHDHPNKADKADKAKDGAEKKHKPCKHKKDKHAKHGDTATTNKEQDISVSAVSSFAADSTRPQPLTAASFKTVGDYVTRKTSGNLEQDMLVARQQQDLLETPECQSAVLQYTGAWLSVIVTGLLAVFYAARRRTLLREKFGIAGSKFGDFCAWCWCAPCALCQETRTLWSNNVRAGTWHGPDAQYIAVPTTDSPPQTQFMTV